MSKIKNILITSGGTIVPLDDVRHIGNFSSGSFLARIAQAAINGGYQTYYLHSKNAKFPIVAKNRQSIFHSVEFVTFTDYVKELKKLIAGNKIDIAFLGAAVSDYSAKAKPGKISSDKDELIIKLVKNPKVIKLVKSWAKNHIFQVGFKLLSNVSEEELIETAYKSGLTNQSNLTIANDLKKIRAGQKEAIIVTPERGIEKFNGHKAAKEVFDFTIRRAQETYFKTLIKSDKKYLDKYGPEIKIMRETARKMITQKMMIPFFSGSSFYHGSISLRTNDNKLLITARGSDKRNLSSQDVVLVDRVDLANKKIYTKSINGIKPSLNALLSFFIFKQFSKIKFIIHGHQLVSGLSTTKYNHTPGTLEYAKSPLNLLKGSSLINLKNHGFIAIGDNINQIFDYVIKKQK